MTDTLAALVRRASVNPMGRQVSGPHYLETRVSEYLMQRFTAAGLPCFRHQVSPGRCNVYARLDATLPGAPVILWDAHQDTVPVDGMTIAPFTPVVQDGKLYGRGACDVKGGMTAMLEALEHLRSSEAPRYATILFAATINEEFGFSGAKALSSLWGTSASASPLKQFVGSVPDAAIVAEPTELNIITQHKGAVRWQVRIHGTASHSSFPEHGKNAIYRAGHVILAVESLAADLTSKNKDNPCGPPTVSIGTVQGGVGVNLVPDLVVLEIERRVLPEEIPSEARADVVDRIRSEYDDPAVEHITPFLESGGLSHQNPDSKCVTESLSSAARLVGYSPQCCAARYGTNASIYASVGIPSVVFGPGSIDQAHTADEWIELKQIDQAISTLVATVANPPTFVGDFNRPK